MTHQLIVEVEQLRRQVKLLEASQSALLAKLKATQKVSRRRLQRIRQERELREAFQATDERRNQLPDVPQVRWP